MKIMLKVIEYIALYGFIAWRFFAAYVIPKSILRKETSKDAMLFLWIQAIIFLVVPVCILNKNLGKIGVNILILSIIFIVLSIFSGVNIAMFYLKKSESTASNSE